MTIIYWIFGILAVALLIYLIIGLFHPEDFS